jgi:hypothetical protein
MYQEVEKILIEERIAFSTSPNLIREKYSKDYGLNKYLVWKREVKTQF